MPAPQTHVHSSSDTPVAFDRQRVYIIYSDHHQSPEKLSHLIQERKAFLGCEQICFSEGVLSLERTLLQTAPCKHVERNECIQSFNIPPDYLL